MADTGTHGQDDDGSGADQLLCVHRWVRVAADDAPPRCVSCNLDYREYVEGTVRGALSRMGAWE